MEIGGVQKTTLIDYPGHIAATVFLVGCNFRCPFCYSSELVLPEKIKCQPKLSEKAIFEFLKKRKGLIEGVVICGGEPTIHKDLETFIRKIKKLGYLIKLDTNGSNPQILKKLVQEGLLDYVAMDIKAPKQKYEKATGVKIDIKKIQKSIDILKQSGIDYEFRSTIVPSLHSKEDVVEMAKWLAGSRKYYWQNFRPEKTVDPKFEKIKPYLQKFFLEVKKEVGNFFEICDIRG